MRRVWLLIAALVALAAPFLRPATATAHPLGNFTVNRYSRLEPAAGALRVRYVLDLAEIPTFQEMAAIDRDRDGLISEVENRAYAARKADEIAANLHLTVNGAPAPLAVRERDLSFPTGQGGLTTLRLALWLEARLPVAATYEADYRDDNYGDRIGWKEIVVRAGSGMRVEAASVPSADQSRELTAYPEDMLASPLDRRQARFRFAPAAGTTPESPLSLPGIQRQTDAVAALVTAQELTLPAILLSLALAAGLGALHAMSPGHGKAIVAAYLIGARGTAKHALFLGLTVTATHTIGVFALGLVTLFAAQFILPERLYPWLSLASGLLVLALGAGLFVGRLRRLSRDAQAHIHPAHAGHSHPPAAAPADRPAPAAGLTPALAGAAAGHGAHRHAFAVDVHVHGPAGTHTHPREPAHHGHDHDRDHEHGHSHTLPDGPVTWRSLLALGISGGLLPCPSALVVLLGAIALHRVGLGLLLIVAFSLGLAGVLTATGLLLVYAGRLFNRLPVSGRLLRALPVASAAVVAGAGLLIVAQALIQAGVV